jgi:cytochrome c biogenesis protein CcmG/thiol:disulfide interchange protein DsbE
MSRVRIAIVASIMLASCSSVPVGPLPPPPTATTTEEVLALVAEGPAVVNVWASWCLPCRSEAPLITSATLRAGDVRFIGLDVRDDPDDARAFIARHLADADMIHLADRSGSIPIDLGGTKGVPLTFFYDGSGSLVHAHFGVIDEPTMARYLDEIRR